MFISGEGGIIRAAEGVIYYITMTQQTDYTSLVLLYLHICQFFPIKVTAAMINYFEFQLPDPTHCQDQFDQLHSPHDCLLPDLPAPASSLVPLHQMHFSHDFLPDSYFHFADTLESEARPALQSDPAPESPSEEVWGKEEEVRGQRVKNETKNIPKNFGKGIISFIEKNERKVRALLRQERVTYSCFIEMMREEKRSINTMQDLRRLWTHETYGKCLRIISNLFFRRHALDYIFNSRISNFASHVKYRQTLWNAIRNPHQFNRIKEF